jgi:hypothetical protein
MKERKQNFELLRIIAMFMIVISHVSTHYISAYDVQLASFNVFFIIYFTITYFNLREYLYIDYGLFFNSFN